MPQMVCFGLSLSIVTNVAGPAQWLARLGASEWARQWHGWSMALKYEINHCVFGRHAPNQGGFFANIGTTNDRSSWCFGFLVKYEGSSEGDVVSVRESMGLLYRKVAR